MKDLKGSKTEANLMTAFAGESQARNKYTYYASKAKKEGYEQIAAIFEETAGNEKEHAKMWFKLLVGGEVPDTITNLEDAINVTNVEQAPYEVVAPILGPEENKSLDDFITPVMEDKTDSEPIEDDNKVISFESIASEIKEEKMESAKSVDEGFVHVDNVLSFADNYSEAPSMRRAA